MTETNTRAPGRAGRAWHAVADPRRRLRFRTWRKTPAIVTRGYLAFRDVIVIALCTALVLAGVSVVRDLRAEDCRAANARRAEVKDIALRLLGNERFLLELADTISPGGLPPAFEVPLRARYDELEADINAAYEPMPCPA